MFYYFNIEVPTNRTSANRQNIEILHQLLDFIGQLQKIKLQNTISTYEYIQLNVNKKQIGYMFKHSLRNVTEHTIAYLADSPICLSLNLLFHYDEEMSNMTSSFIQSESSLNLSTLSDKAPKS